MVINCYIVNKEPAALALLSQYVTKTLGLKLIGCSSDPLDALAKIGRAEVIADMVFLDSEVLRWSDIVSERSALLNSDTQVVFSSPDNDLAAAAFDWNAVDYLQQPVSYERFLMCIDRVRERLERTNGIAGRQVPYFFIQSDIKGKLFRIVKDEILYVECALNYLHIHLDRKSHVTYLTIREMEDRLTMPQFVRVHKSFMINLDKVVSVEGNRICLTNNVKIVLGPSYRDAFFERLSTLLVKSKRLA
jgi:DNA-binding LytR/AlgR family response regulator